jgi:hypothetical protein
MSAARKGAGVPVALGFRAGRGGSIVVAVARDGRDARVVLSTFLATAEEGDRLSLEPYHVAAELARGSEGKPPKDAVSAVTEGRKRQDRIAAKGLADLVNKLEGERCKPVRAALLVNRAGWVTDLLEYSLFSPDHPPVAEGLAVRDALRHAFARCGLDAVETDEKSLLDSAAKTLGLSATQLDTQLKSLGDGAKPWRKEHKLACLAAWLAISAR